MISADDFLNGAVAGPQISPPITAGTNPANANGAGGQSNIGTNTGITRSGKTYSSSNSAIVLAWAIMLVLLVLSHTFTASLQE